MLTFENIEELIAKSLGNNKTQTMSKQEVQDYFDAAYRQKCVLGIDVYRYSQADLTSQSMIPYVLSLLYRETIRFLEKQESSFYYGFSRSEFKKFFIDTGDGGFLIRDTPYHALVFVIYFSFNLSRYNSRKLKPEVHDLVGSLSLRYAMTMDTIFEFEENWYGPAIISCARILSKDRLNRFLIDEGVKSWFDKHFNGVESLKGLGWNNLKNNPVLNELTDNVNDLVSLIMPKKGCDAWKSNILAVNLSKIGTIQSKEQSLSVYSLHFQIYLVLSQLLPALQQNKFVVTIGNLNASGL